jgi:NAD(P)-dependent dehydrogenase (short-subunit alcohol dehydrogenase family)
MTGSGDPRSSQTVLITGATDGLGRATALLLARQGYRVFAAGRSAEKRAALDRAAAEHSLPLTSVEMDVCDEHSVARGLQRIRSAAGPVDVLVNNAGVAYVAAMEEIRLDDLRRQFETNFFAPVRLIQAVLPEMRQRHSGRIVNMSSIAGKVTIPLFGPYSSSKYALEAISDALRLELHPFGIHVVLIEPAYIPTGMESASVELSAEYAGKAQSSPYAAVYEGFRRAWKRNRHKEPDGKKSPSKSRPLATPDDCARVILRALRDTPPRPRYTVTRAAQIGVLVKRLLSDRALDRRLLQQYGLVGPIARLGS